MKVIVTSEFVLTGSAVEMAYCRVGGSVQPLAQSVLAPTLGLQGGLGYQTKNKKGGNGSSGAFFGKSESFSNSLAILIISWLFPPNSGDRVIILQELEESRRTFLYLALHVLVMILKNFYVFSDLY